jgi:hypothetical protein
MNKRIISWSVGEVTFSRGFIFGNYNNSYSAFTKLIKEAKKDFPSLSNEDIELSKITKSSYMKGFIFVSFPVRAKMVHKEYSNWSRFDFDDH